MITGCDVLQKTELNNELSKRLAWKNLKKIEKKQKEPHVDQRWSRYKREYNWKHFEKHYRALEPIRHHGWFLFFYEAHCVIFVSSQMGVFYLNKYFFDTVWSHIILSFLSSINLLRLGLLENTYFLPGALPLGSRKVIRDLSFDVITFSFFHLDRFNTPVFWATTCVYVYPFKSPGR